MLMYSSDHTAINNKAGFKIPHSYLKRCSVSNDRALLSLETSQQAQWRPSNNVAIIKIIFIL